MAKRELLPPAQMDAERAEAALKRRDEFDYQSYMVLQKLVRQVRGVLPGQLHRLDDEEREALLETLERAEEVLSLRSEANDEFIKAMIGR